MKPLNIRIRRNDFDALMGHLHRDGNEQHAFMLCGSSELDGLDLLTVREVHFADPAADLTAQTPAYVSLKPAYALRILERAADQGLHIVDVHSHPFCGTGVRFSATDTHAASKRFAWHRERIPSMTSVGLVFGRQSVFGEYSKPFAPCVRRVNQLEVVGKDRLVWDAKGGPDPTPRSVPARFVRQVLAFGPEAQSQLARITVGIVGCGGTGSAVAQQLAHLGVGRFVLCDADSICESNLNRLIGGLPEDARSGLAKVLVAERMIMAINPEASVTPILEFAQSAVARRALAGSDALFGCVDNSGARAVLTDLACRCLIPYLDLGVGIEAQDGRIASAGGQVAAYWPGCACLGCRHHLDPDRVAQGLRSESERLADEQVYGVPHPQPSVVGLNGVVASLAVGEFLKHVTSWAEPGERLQHDAVTGGVVPVATMASGQCPYCSAQGLLGLGLDETMDDSHLASLPLGATA